MRNRIVVLLMTVLTMLSACIGGGHETTSSEESASIGQTLGQTTTPIEESVTPVEETVPFDVSADAKVYNYDRDNLLGLNAVIVNGPSEVIYVFDLRKDFVEYSKGDGFSIYGLNPWDESFQIREFWFEKDDYWQYMLLKSDEDKEIDGFYLANMISDYQYEMKKNSLPVVCEYEYGFSKKTIPVPVRISSQSYDANKKAWNEVEQSEDVLQLEIQKD